MGYKLGHLSGLPTGVFDRTLSRAQEHWLCPETMGVERTWPPSGSRKLHHRAERREAAVPHRS
jgi:hypothetical protein